MQAHIGNRFSLTVDLSQSSAETALGCSSQRTEEKGGAEGGCSFETHLPHLTGCGVRPSLFFFLFTATHFLSFSVCIPLFLGLSSPNGCLFSSCKAHVSLLSAVWFFKCQHSAAMPGWRSYPGLSGTVRGPCRALVRWNSQGPNVNTACDTPSQHAFKPSNRGS